MALALPKLALPKLSLNRTQILIAVGVLVVIVAGGWFGWDYFFEEPPPPPKPAAKAAAVSGPAKQAAAAKAAAASAEAQGKLIEDVLAASGAKQLVNRLPGQLAAGIRESSRQNARNAPAIAKNLEAAVAESFVAQASHDQLTADLKRHFDQQRLQALLSDLATPAGKRMVELEQTSPPQDELNRFARGLAKTPLSPQRSGLIRRIDAAKKTSDLAIGIALASMDAVTSAIAGKEAKKPATVDKTKDAQRASATEKIRSATSLNLAFSYQGATDSELEAYAKLAESDSAKWFNNIVYESLLQQSKSAAADAGERIDELASKPAAARPEAPAARSKAPAAETAASAARPAHAKAHGDARKCLELETNAKIMQCAEQYR